MKKFSDIFWREYRNSKKIENFFSKGRRKIFDPKLPSDSIANVVEHIRNEWVASKASRLKPETKVLDVGAGECKYRKLFVHCDYTTQDFAQYSGTKDGLLREEWKYGHIDIISDILNIPVPSSSFDVILCTEVLEHIPDPIGVMKEFGRILSPKGQLWLSAPLACGLHQQPYHYYGGFTPYFYQKYLIENDFEIKAITPIGGLFKHVAQEVYRAGRVLRDRNPRKNTFWREYLLTIWLPSFLFDVEKDIFIEEFTLGYLVDAVKK